MASPRDAIVIPDDDDVGTFSGFQLSRSLSTVSMASSHTMRAESPEPEVVPAMERLSVQPSATRQPSQQGISEIRQDAQSSLALPFSHVSNNGGSRRRGSESIGENGPCQRRPRLSRNDRAGIFCVSSDKPEVVPRFNPAKHRLIEIEDSDEEDLEERASNENLEEKLQDRQPRRGPKSRGASILPRNPQIVAPLEKIDSYQWCGVSIRAGDAIELADGNFMKIKYIVKHQQTDEIKIRGWLLQRSRMMRDCVLPMTLNELCFIFEQDLDDPRSVWEQSVLEVTPDDIIQIREVICTNRSSPQCRYKRDNVPKQYRQNQSLLKQWVATKEVLVARWKHTTRFETACQRVENPQKTDNGLNYESRRLESLTDEECSGRCSIPASMRRFIFRRCETELFGSGTRLKAGKEKSKQTPDASRTGGSVQTPICLDNESDDDSNKETEKVYTCGDACSGAGGTLLGAAMADFQLKWGLDFNSDACATQRANFPQLEVFEMEAQMLVALAKSDFAFARRLLADFFHLSPPCQVFSQAHAKPGKDDAMNYASLFMILELIKAVRPRIVTLEQTSGIMRPQFRDAFNQVIHAFTSNGYSVSWRVVQFLKFGLPQSRNRLIIVAACPGETIPDFPAYTHNEDGSGGLQKYASVQSFLDDIPHDAPNHEIPHNDPGRYTWWDASTHTTCITTSGDQKHPGHPSGTRGWTHRELAALQGFPHNHVFVARAIRKQIGNAVPPIIAKILFEKIRKHLERVDAAEERRARAQCR